MLQQALVKLQEIDTNNIFAQPVDTNQVRTCLLCLFIMLLPGPVMFMVIKMLMVINKCSYYLHIY